MSLGASKTWLRRPIVQHDGGNALFYRDIMKFPIETDRKNWVSFRVGATLLTLRPRGPWAVCDDGRSIPGSAAYRTGLSSSAPSGRCLP